MEHNDMNLLDAASMRSVFGEKCGVLLDAVKGCCELYILYQVVSWFGTMMDVVRIPMG